MLHDKIPPWYDVTLTKYRLQLNIKLSFIMRRSVAQPGQFWWNIDYRTSLHIGVFPKGSEETVFGFVMTFQFSLFV